MRHNCLDKMVRLLYVAVALPAVIACSVAGYVESSRQFTTSLACGSRGGCFFAVVTNAGRQRSTEVIFARRWPCEQPLVTELHEWSGRHAGGIPIAMIPGSSTKWHLLVLDIGWGRAEVAGFSDDRTVPLDEGYQRDPARQIILLSQTPCAIVNFNRAQLSLLSVVSLSPWIVIVIYKCKNRALAKWRSRHTRPGCCLHCGYDLRASAGRCPECGNRGQKTSK